MRAYLASYSLCLSHRPVSAAHSSFHLRFPARRWFFLDSLSSFSSKPPPKRFTAPDSRWAFASARASAREDVVILGIETSCDDTAAAVVDFLFHYGGVDPKMAQEAHELAIDQVVQQAHEDANLTEKELSAVAVTIGPGLSLCLRDRERG